MLDCSATARPRVDSEGTLFTFPPAMAPSDATSEARLYGESVSQLDAHPLAIRDSSHPFDQPASRSDSDSRLKRSHALPINPPVISHLLAQPTSTPSST